MGETYCAEAIREARDHNQDGIIIELRIPSGLTRWESQTVKSAHYISIGTAALVFMALAGYVSLREYTLHGSVAVFCILTSVFALLTSIVGRPLTSAILAGGVIGLIDYADRFKFRETRQHLHHHDFNIALQFFREMELGIIYQYWDASVLVFLSLFLYIILVYFLWLLEKPMFRSLTTRLITIATLALLVAQGSWTFMASSYLAAVKEQMPARLAADRAPLRMSAALAALSASLALADTLTLDAAKNPPASKSSGTRNCVNCPDIIVIHLESVYDPQMEEAYAHLPPLAQLIETDMNVWNTSMRVHTWGGNSVVTEFELLCSVNHELFGWGGLQPHINVAPHVRGCFGTDLKQLGYDNQVLYSLNGSFSGVRAAFERYGFDKFSDFTQLNLPKRWSELRDRLIYNKLIEKMQVARESPRTFFVSTNWNHGPHGLEKASSQYEGPYDPQKADSKPLSDFVNRLNDSVTALQELFNFVEGLDYPVVVLAYGDHHPAFPKNYSDRSRDAFNDPDYVTPLMLFRNFTGKQLEPQQMITVEEAMYYLVEFSGLPPLEYLKLIRSIQARCGDDQRSCDETYRSRLRSLHLELEAP